MINIQRINPLVYGNSMTKRSVNINRHDDIFPLLKGRVFHVTSTVSMKSIRSAGSITPNIRLEQESLFENTSNGFFRLRECVSFFDYRNFGSKEWKEHALKCHPARALDYSSSITILFLCKNIYPHLISWAGWKDEEAWSEHVVPFIEIGHKGAVSLDNITDELIVEWR